MAALFHNMTVDIVGYSTGGEQRGGENRHINLPAMRMPAKRQRNPVRHVLEYIRFMRQKHDWCIIFHLRQCAGQIVGADVLSSWPGPLIGEARDPEGVTALVQAYRLVFKQLDACMGQYAADAFAVIAAHIGKRAMPPVMIAENCIGAEGGFEDREGFGPLIGHNGTGDEFMTAVEITQQKDYVGVK